MPNRAQNEQRHQDPEGAAEDEDRLERFGRIHFGADAEAIFIQPAPCSDTGRAAIIAIAVGVVTGLSLHRRCRQARERLIAPVERRPFALGHVDLRIANLDCQDGA